MRITFPLCATKNKLIINSARGRLIIFGYPLIRVKNISNLQINKKFFIDIIQSKFGLNIPDV